MNKLVGQRDYSSQEVMHTLFGLPLVHCTRTSILVDCRPEDTLPTTYFFHYQQQDVGDNGDTTSFKEGRSVLQKYKERPDELTTITYLDFLLHFGHGKKDMR